MLSLITSSRKNGMFDYLIIKLLEEYTSISNNSNNQQTVTNILSKNILILLYIIFLFILKNSKVGFSHIFIDNRNRLLIFLSFFNLLLMFDNKLLEHSLIKFAGFFISSQLIFYKFRAFSIGFNLLLADIIFKLIETQSYDNKAYSNFIIYSAITQISLYSTWNTLLTKANNDSKWNKFINLTSSTISLFIFNIHANYIKDFLTSKQYNILSYITKLLLNYSTIFCYWATLLLLGILYIQKMNATRKILRRKYFHILAIGIYLPGFIQMRKADLLFFSLIILYLFIALEILRNMDSMRDKLSFISDYLQKYIDSRDCKDFILSHTFLLFGCFSPLLLQHLYNKAVPSILGLTVLGIGDSVASYVGSNYGRIKVYPLTDKTLEGTIAAVLCSALFISCFQREIAGFECKKSFILSYS